MYGVLRKETLIKSGRGIKRALEINDLIDTFRPRVISKIHEGTPPSILLDNDNITRLCHASKIQRHPATEPLRFLYRLYCLNKNWTVLTKLLSAKESELVVLDQDFIDLSQPYNLLDRCNNSLVVAAEVHLTGNAALELIRTRVPSRDVTQATRFQTTLEEKGADVNVTDRHLHTPLVCRYGHGSLDSWCGRRSSHAPNSRRKGGMREKACWRIPASSPA